MYALNSKGDRQETLASAIKVDCLEHILLMAFNCNYGGLEDARKTFSDAIDGGALSVDGQYVAAYGQFESVAKAAGFVGLGRLYPRL
jgi:hypothetical protein